MTSGPPTPALSVTFWGAARAVTGSMHLVEAAGRRVLLDCGLVRGAHAEAHAPGFPFDPRTLDAVVLTHAHIDHCGNLPALVRRGFDGPIYCTAATRDLTAVMLADSARIQEERALLAYVTGRGEPADTPSSRADADQAVRQCVPLDYEQPVTVGDVAVRLVNAGHLLGSAMVALAAPGPRRDRTLTYTGDLGRLDLPLHSPPATVPPADLLLCESTYGGRRHDSVPRTTELLVEIVRRTVGRGGKVLVPAFSLGRTQLVLAVLQAALWRGDLPPVEVFVDSPLAAEITAVYRAHPELLPPGPADPAAFLGGPHIHYVVGRAESQELAERAGPCVIVAASGMCEAGRILHHLKRNVDDPRASVVLVSYQAPHTVGHRLLERGPTVHVHGRTWNKWAEVYELNGFSGHADHADFLALLGPLAGRVGRVRLVHGEPESAAALADGLRGVGFADVAVPGRGDTTVMSDE
jgi:metallo-beta-lactamase family protein